MFRTIGTAFAMLTAGVITAALGAPAQAAHSTTSYQLLLQSRADTAAPNEVYLASFASLDDLISETIGTPSEFTEIDVTPNFRIAGFSSVTTAIEHPPVPGVPEPATWAFMICGMGSVGLVLRRRRTRAAA